MKELLGGEVVAVGKGLDGRNHLVAAGPSCCREEDDGFIEASK